jgi:hypothetical protein
MPSSTEFSEMMEQIGQADPRAAALVLAFIDSLLEFAIKINFVDLDETAFNKLFRDPTAPLSSFSAKISVAHALGVYGDEIRSQLDRLRIIRNAFAHSIRPITFDEPLVRKECFRLDPAALIDAEYQADADAARERFTVVSQIIATQLLVYTNAIHAAVQAKGRRKPFLQKLAVQHYRDLRNRDQTAKAQEPPPRS